MPSTAHTTESGRNAVTIVTPVTDTAIDPRIARSRAKVIEAARQLLVEHGPRGVTVDAVSERSGVAKSTMYRHWDSRNELLVELVHSCLPEMPEPDLDAGFEPCLRGYVGDVAQALADDSYALTIAALVPLSRQVPELTDAVESEREQRLAVIEDILAVGRREGAVGDDIDADRLTALVFGPLIFEAAFARRPDASDAEHVRTMTQLATDVLDRVVPSLAR